jgi:beta-lactam-binding protein with PASTA domain
MKTQQARRRIVFGGNAFMNIKFFLLILCFFSSTFSLTAVAAETGAIRPGFDTNALAATDDGSTGLVPLGFSVNFFGNSYSQGYVNNNGNMTFDAALSTFTPFGLAGTTRSIIAPFFADVDTRSANSSPVSFGQGRVGTRNAFGVNWVNVGCYNVNDAGGFSSFQMVLIDRSDIGAGDFDIEFNYQMIAWETGQASGGSTICQGGSSARVGYSNGSTTSFELFGSGVNSAFLDSNLDTGLIHTSRNSLQPGRYVFEVRNGLAPVGHSIAGTVYGDSTDNPLASALVQICTTSGDLHCNLTRTNASGAYLVDGLSDGTYDVRAFPPTNTNYRTAALSGVSLAGSDLNNQNITLQSPQPLPNNTTVLPNLGISASGEPIVYWHETLNFSTRGCTGGTGSYAISNSQGTVIRTGALAETSPGVFTASASPFYPVTGHVTVSLSLSCPDGSHPSVVFSMYIDPSGMVKNQLGQPVSNATVTLYRSDSSAGPFTVVPDGSDIMSPVNRVNPMPTNSQGLFGWDVVTGFYVVRAQASGCTSPSDAAVNFVETPVLTIPPAVTDLELTLNCPSAALVEVPDVVGQTQANAEAALSAVGLTANISTTSSNTVAAGVVISQNPQTGASLARGSSVDVVVSSGPVIVTVPVVAGLSQVEAKTALEAIGLVANITTASSTSVPAGLVISQNPTSGALVAVGSTVEVVVSSGAPLLPVPSVINQSQADAEAALVTAGFTVDVATASSTTVPVGNVISQTPLAGVSQAPGSVVTIVVSTGPSITVSSFSVFRPKVEVNIKKRKISFEGRIKLSPDSDGLDFSKDVIKFTIGSITKTVTAKRLNYHRSCKTYDFVGMIDGNKIEIHLRKSGHKSFVAEIEVYQVNTAAFPVNGKVDVSLSIGNDAGVATQVRIVKD